MNKRRTKPLIPPLRGRWARVGLTALLITFVTIGAQAQTADEGAAQLPRDRNTELRTRTWSVFAQGGLSWATDVWYQNINAKRSYSLSPAVGGGVDFTIRPWVRVGAEYLWSSYRREQRFARLDTRTMPVKTYGNYLMDYHNAKLGVGFDLMELRPSRRAQRLHIWAGTGVGCTFARGNEYGIYFSNTKTADGTTTPFAEGESVTNGGSVTLTGSVQTKNRHEDFTALYLPLFLHLEADVSRRLSIGLRGEIDWLPGGGEIAPGSLVFALASLRYHFVPSRARVLQSYYEGEISTLTDRLNELRREAAEAKATAEGLESARRQAEQQSADLSRRLSDCEESRAEATEVAAGVSHIVQFDHNSSYMSPDESDRLRAFARSVQGRTLSIVAEASTPGSDDYNQTLSERRLQRVVDALLEEGFAPDHLRPTTAIGSRNGKPAAEGRRVTITVK